MTTRIRSFLYAVACATPLWSLGAVAADPATTNVTPANVPAPSAAEAAMGPQELMEKVAQDLLDDLNANREATRKDPQLLRAMVDRHLLPHFDTNYAAQLVLGKCMRRQCGVPSRPPMTRSRG